VNISSWIRFVDTWSDVILGGSVAGEVCASFLGYVNRFMSVVVVVLPPLFNMLFPCVWTGRVSSVGIATCYGLDGPCIESRWGRDFPHPYRPTLEPTRLLYNGYRVFIGGITAGVWL